MSGRGRLVIGLGLALALCVGGVAAAVTTPDAEPVAVVAPDFRLRGFGDASELVPIHRFQAGRAVVPQLVSYPVPAPAPGTPPVAVSANPTWEGFPLVVAILDVTDDGQWAQVRLPQRPNGTTGWVQTAYLEVWTVPNRVEVVLSANRLRVYDGDSDNVLFEALVAVGKGSTPTPAGEFYIDIVNPLGHHRTYGWGQLSVAGFSEVYSSFGGGIGQIALHGWNNDDVMGSAVSNGCVRMRNADIARVAELAPLGTPVSIVP